MTDDLSDKYIVSFDPANDTIQPIVTRVVGTGPTTFTYKGEPIAYIDPFEPITQHEPVTSAVIDRLSVAINDAVEPGTVYLMPYFEPRKMWDDVKALYDQYKASTAPRMNLVSAAMDQYRALYDLSYLSIEPVADCLRRISTDFGPLVTYVDINAAVDNLKLEAEQEAALDRLLANEPEPESYDWSKMPRLSIPPMTDEDRQDDIIADLIGHAPVCTWTEDWYETTPWGSTAKAPIGHHRRLALLRAQMFDLDDVIEPSVFTGPDIDLDIDQERRKILRDYLNDMYAMKPQSIAMITDVN